MINYRHPSQSSAKTQIWIRDEGRNEASETQLPAYPAIVSDKAKMVKGSASKSDFRLNTRSRVRENGEKLAILLQYQTTSAEEYSSREPEKMGNKRIQRHFRLNRSKIDKQSESYTGGPDDRKEENVHSYSFDIKRGVEESNIDEKNFERRRDLNLNLVKSPKKMQWEREERMFKDFIRKHMEGEPVTNALGDLASTGEFP